MGTEAEATPDRRSRDVPESLRLRTIAPSLTVKNVQASIAWYRDVVGFVVEREWEHDGKIMGATLVAGSAHLLIGQDDGAKGWDRVKGEGFRIYLNTAQDIDQVAANIKARGGSLATEPADTPWGSRAFNLVDPDGFQLTISSTE